MISRCFLCLAFSLSLSNTFSSGDLSHKYDSGFPAGFFLAFSLSLSNTFSSGDLSHKYDSGFPAAFSLSLSLLCVCIAFSIDGNVGFTHFYSNSTLKDLPLQYVQYKFLEQSIAKIS